MLHPLRRAPILPTRGRRTALPPVYRLTPSAAADAAPCAGRRDDKLAKLEAALWLADEPMSPRRLATLAELKDALEARRLIDRLRSLLEADGSAFEIEELAGGFQLFTRPEFYPWLARLRRAGGDAKLSPILLETLAIVAYRQPINRAEIEGIRGVHCGDALRQLVERKLITIVGREDSLGRPVLYGTTKKFLQTFGLKDLKELPAVEGASG